MISAIILAAGLSKRMELGNKLLLEKKETPIIKITLDNIKAAKVKEIIIVLGKNSKSFKNVIEDKSVKLFFNSNYKNGISSSIKKGIEKVDNSCEGALICLADMPSIKTSTYNKIIDAFYKYKKQNIIPYFNKKKGNPVLFSKSYFKYITNITGDVGARNLIRKYKKDFKKLTVTDVGILEDIDNKEQYYNFIRDEKTD